MKFKALKIATWNSNGILNKIDSFELFLNNQNIDVCLLSETHFAKRSALKIRNYKIYHALHPDNVCRMAVL